MVYKSFLIDHHFCIFRGIFAIFEQFHSKSSDRVTENPLPDLFLCPKKRYFTLEVCRTISTARQDLNTKTELKNLFIASMTSPRRIRHTTKKRTNLRGGVVFEKRAAPFANITSVGSFVWFVKVGAFLHKGRAERYRK